MSEKATFKVGSRKSQLALTQTNEVIKQLATLFPEKNFEIVEMMTMGDKIVDKPLPKIGEKSIFTKELELALLNNDIDFVVHSLKDLPTVLPDGLTIGAVLKREDPRDVLILGSKYEAENLKSLPKSSIIGTSSLRRIAQLHRNYPNIKVLNIRGNLNTRIKKLDEDKIYSGIILAAAGIKRMKWENRIREYLDPDEFLYAVGQGALAVECRNHDDVVLEILENLNHIPTILQVISERSFLKSLGGGCSAPVAVHTVFSDKELIITGAVWSVDGTKTIKKIAKTSIHYEDSEPPKKLPNTERKPYGSISLRNIELNDLKAVEDLGEELAQDMIKSGALNIIAEAKLMNEKEDFVYNDKSKSIDNGLDVNRIENNASR